ncbi:hypothetical protein VFPFJ_02820 [Purpureocillium lilacinum]|uniref:Uncharacterized protein n=1 Tax=Purpureocillium lilacinum TaxID=33203 RepID=A0A179GN52_PURLI|nr:hypothetical protein VFPFJ_02820 [Purpureocillium lilacinum]OAQ78599.1 hypothetical protein VFPBJ_06720 [Purpureocillium lilacinum]OAQ93658.1 hypothetical protein VFPFJ_02820 [Purpureocillium lilacinum]
MALVGDQAPLRPCAPRHDATPCFADAWRIVHDGEPSSSAGNSAGPGTCQVEPRGSWTIGRRVWKQHATVQLLCLRRGGSRVELPAQGQTWPVSWPES